MTPSRVVLFSDVHSNYPALLAVLRDVRDRGGVDAYWFLGDTVGYNAQPWECLQTLYDLLGEDQPWLLGNHDLATVLLAENPARADDPLVHDLVGGDNHGHAFQVVQWHAFELAGLKDLRPYQRMREALTWATPLPGIALAHGMFLAPADSPENVIAGRSYLDSYERARSALGYLRDSAGYPCHLLCVGHTHVAQVMWSQDASLERWHEPGSLRVGALDEPCETLVELPPMESRWAVVCPGSVGQSRDGDRRAAYAVLDLENGRQTVSFRRVPYPFQVVQERMRQDGYPTWYIKRLELGR